jgi:hypothetical protein
VDRRVQTLLLLKTRSFVLAMYTQVNFDTLEGYRGLSSLPVGNFLDPADDVVIFAAQSESRTWFGYQGIASDRPTAGELL